MILTRDVEIKITERNISYYEHLGYDDITTGDIIRIPIELLPNGSHYKITCECDSCGIIKDVIYKNYLKYKSEWGEYTCRKCSEPKRKKSLKEKWGVEFPMQNPELLKKMKETFRKKWYEEYD